MPTKTFSGRADESKLQYADLVCKQEAGMTFGQFCASTLVDYIYESGQLPDLRANGEPSSAIARMQRIIKQVESTYSTPRRSGASLQKGEPPQRNKGSQQGAATHQTAAATHDSATMQNNA